MKLRIIGKVSEYIHGKIVHSIKLQLIRPSILVLRIELLFLYFTAMTVNFCFRDNYFFFNNIDSEFFFLFSM